MPTSEEEEWPAGLPDEVAAELRETLHSPPVPGGESKLSAELQGDKLRTMAEAMRQTPERWVELMTEALGRPLTAEEERDARETAADRNWA